MIPKVPNGTGKAGRALWRAVLAGEGESHHGFELQTHELALLREAVRTVDLLDELDAQVKADGAMITTALGVKAHPAAVEARQQRITLARLLAALRVPMGEDGDQQASARPQRRVGVRGTYGIKGLVS